MPIPGTLHHIELYVSDLARSMVLWSWFLEQFGYECVSAWDEGQSWQLGDTYIVFVQVAQKHLEPTYHRCKVGLNHLAFHAQSRQQVDEITEGLRAREATILYEEKHPFAGGPHYYAVFFEDPDRIKVELVAPS